MTAPMSLRRIFFRMMLWSLGVTAAAGFLTMLIGSYQVTGRIAASSLATAIASAFMWRLQSVLDDGDKFVSGLVGMSATGSCFLLALFGIWVSEGAWRWWFTILAIGTTTPPVMGCLRLATWRRGIYAGVVGLLFSSVVLIVWLTAIWLVSRESGRWIGTVLAVAACGALVTLCLIGVSLSTRRDWRWAGVVCSLLGGLLALHTIWSTPTFRDTEVGIITVLASVALVIVHVNLAMLAPLRPKQMWVRWGTIASAVLAAGCVDLIVLLGLSSDHVAARLASALAAVAGCGSVALAVLAAFNRSSVVPTAAGLQKIDPANIGQVTIICPSCARRQTLRLGTARCAKCGLQIYISVEAAEPVTAR